MYLQHEQRLGSTGLGLCVVPKAATVRKLVCTEADLASIGARMGKGRALVIREVRTALEEALGRALVLIERAESQLKMPRATGEGGNAMRLRFRNAFGTTPEFVPTWRPAGQTWDVGAVVRERLRCAAKIMAQGDIEFVAWGPRSCPFQVNWTARHWASVMPGEMRICFGPQFWRAAGTGNIEEMATTILHECLHIYFDTIRHRLERWAYNTATCYERYVLLCSGIPIPRTVSASCPSKLAGAGIGELAQPRDTSDAGRSIEALTKALQINPADGYIKGSAARRKLDIAILSVPLTSALELHGQLSAGTGALGRLFKHRLHRDTRKTLLGVLWAKHLAQQKLHADAQRVLKDACDAAKSGVATLRAAITATERATDAVCKTSGEESDACQKARFDLAAAKLRFDDKARAVQSRCP